VKDENGALLADSHNVLNKWKDYVCQLLNVHRVSDISPIEIHTTEPLIPDLVLLRTKLLLQSSRV
jgi:hypothetical protein